jgi:hypothetical protein
MMKLGIALAAVVVCNTQMASAQTKKAAALPHVLVYKTKANYRNLVPVELSADKNEVVSYPAPTDIKTGSGFPLPVSLHKGYLLDKRGVGTNSAFLKLTYQEYSRLKTVPSPDELLKLVVDKDPITELCDCGTRGKYTTAQLNELIDKKQLKKKCKVIK